MASIPEEQETALDEARETPEEQQTEQDMGQEQHGSVPLSEEFQLMVVDLVKNLSKDECQFLRQQMQNREDELYKTSEPTMEDFEAAKE